MNTLYYGDNLEILKQYIKDESVDLVYLDPPFNSDQEYNMLFAEQDGTRSAAQIKAFKDTWRWDEGSARTYQQVVETGPEHVSRALQSFRTFLGENDMLAYLSMMAPRLVELRRILKPTGSIYLHCDPAASHYLKLLMDSVFGPENFRNEIIWQRTRGHYDTRLTRFGAVHDVIFFYARSKERRFNRLRSERPDNAPKTHDLYRHTDGKLYRKDNCRAPGGRGPRYEWNGHIQNWRFTQEESQRLEAEGRIVYSRTGMPRLLRPLDLTKGWTVQDVWVDIDSPNSGSAEILGYPTQKPEALLERIINASSNEGDVVIDPFCGCGTAVAVAQKLKRHWIGIDITHLAITLIRHRLMDSHGKVEYEVIGEPVSLPDAKALAGQDPYQFQWWALGLVGARPVEQKKGADKGIDGRLYFHDGPKKTKQIILSVKSGHVSVKDVRDLRGVIERERAEMGVLIALEPSTQPMKTEAASAGFYKSPWGTHARLQILTIQQLLEGKRIDYPPSQQVNVTFKKAPKAKPRPTGEQLPLPGDSPS